MKRTRKLHLLMASILYKNSLNFESSNVSLFNTLLVVYFTALEVEVVFVKKARKNFIFPPL